jgi:tetratricopeptide (TPR) repeat protein
MRFSPLIVLLLLSGCTQVKPNSNVVTAPVPTAEAVLSETLASFRQARNLPSAIERLDQAIVLRPNWAFAHFVKAFLYEVSEDWQRASSEYTQFLQLDVQSKYADIARYKQRQIERIQRGELTADEFRATNYDVLLMQAQVHLAVGDFQQAAASAEAATVIDANRFEAYYILARAFLELHALPEAIACVKKAHDVAPPEQRPPIKLLFDRLVRLYRIDGNPRGL